ncbi:MAG: flagellin [Clostridia bacterium]
MSMVVRTNTMAINANRSLGVNNSTVAKSLEKLSSGFQINRAADDASGLAISEKMKSQIKGLDQASTNALDGISLIQTAEGATQEIHNMLNRMVELATKSANGTIQDEVDREAITNEINALTTEIDRICDSTTFNGIQLLNGDLANGSASFGTETIGTATDPAKIVVNVTDVKGADLKEGDIYTLTVGQVTSTFEVTAGFLQTNANLADAVVSGNLATELVKGFVASTGTVPQTGLTDTSGVHGTWAAVASGTTITFTSSEKGAGTTVDDDIFGQGISFTGGGRNLQIGDTAHDFNQMLVTVSDLGSAKLSLNKVNVSSDDKARESIQTVNTAINIVSSNRAALGALQNRLEYTINNLDATSENMTAANSRIRDTDMASEMMEYTKNNILVQAAQSMLAQANQSPQNILQLLQ